MLNANANSIAVHAAVKRFIERISRICAGRRSPSYGINFLDTDYRAAAFVDKILRRLGVGKPPHRAFNQITPL